MVFSDIRKVVTWGDAVPVKDPQTAEITIAQGLSVKSSAELDDAAAASIAEIVQTKDGGVRVKLHDKLSGVEKLGKLLGLIKELHEHTGKDGGPIQYQDCDFKRMSDEELHAFIRQAAEEILAEEQENGRSVPAEVDVNPQFEGGGTQQVSARGSYERHRRGSGESGRESRGRHPDHGAVIET